MIKEQRIRNDLKIRLIEINDSKELFNLIDTNREHLYKWLPWVNFTRTEEDSVEFISMAQSDYENLKSVQYALIYKNQIAGMFGINEINKRNKSVSLGYWLGEEYQGNGIVIDSAKFIIEHLFNKENIHRIEIRADKNNLKSRAVPEKLNFSLEGVLKDADYIDNHYEDVHLYSLINTN